MIAKRVPVLATTTTAKAEDAGKIATQLVEKKLAACVQIVEPVVSVYRWKDKIESEREILLLIKTTRDLISRIAELLDEIHPYEVPELVATPIVEGSTAYLSWLEDSVQ
jgi:periplasmic divalent cation tolerance protein